MTLELKKKYVLINDLQYIYKLNTFSIILNAKFITDIYITTLVTVLCKWFIGLNTGLY